MSKKNWQNCLHFYMYIDRRFSKCPEQLQTPWKYLQNTQEGTKGKKKEGVLLSNHIRKRSGQDVTEYWFYISVKLLRKK